MTSHPIFERARIPVPDDLRSVMGNQGNGHKRWQRAAASMERNPRTGGAKLFAERLAAAEAVASWVPADGDHWYQLFRQRWNTGLTYEYQFCSTLHAMLGISLFIPEGVGVAHEARLRQMQEWSKAEHNGVLVKAEDAPQLRSGACNICGVKPPA